MKALVIYTIYEKPKDWPLDFVIKKWIIRAGKPPEQDPEYIFRSATLEPCRDEMRKKYLNNIGTMKGEDPVIVESWI